MQQSRAVTFLGVLTVGLIAGCLTTYGLVYWHANSSFNAQFNSAADALFVEQSSALKALRDGTTRKYQDRLEGVIWQQMSRLSSAKVSGHPLSLSLQSAVDYHCGQLEHGASGATETEAGAHINLCRNLHGG